MKVEFPENDGFHYYNIHVKYILEIFKVVPNILIKMKKIPFDLGNVSFRCYVDGKEIIFDFNDDIYKFGDNLTSKLDIITNVPIFKFHYGRKVNYSHRKNVIPFSPVSFYDWKMYESKLNKIHYIASGKIISRQKPSYGAKERRIYVQSLLKQVYGDNVEINNIKQEQFFDEISNSLVSVCVPGYCNNMLDRGQFQWMAFGGCTISPVIPDCLAWYWELVPGVDYIVCKSDYSDLIEKIEWCRNNRSICIEIGKNAAKLFFMTSVPQKLWEWIIENINNI